MIKNAFQPEVHVKGEVHELLADLAEGEDVEADPHGDGRPPIVGTHPAVVADLEPREEGGDVEALRGVQGEGEGGEEGAEEEPYGHPGPPSCHHWPPTPPHLLACPHCTSHYTPISAPLNQHLGTPPSLHAADLPRLPPPQVTRPKLEQQVVTSQRLRQTQACR